MANTDGRASFATRTLEWMCLAKNGGAVVVAKSIINSRYRGFVVDWMEDVVVLMVWW